MATLVKYGGSYGWSCFSKEGAGVKGWEGTKWWWWIG